MSQETLHPALTSLISIQQSFTFLETPSLEGLRKEYSIHQSLCHQVDKEMCNPIQMHAFMHLFMKHSLR